MTTLFALYPCLGGAPYLFARLAARLAEIGHVHNPTLPGRAGRFGEPAFRDFGALADHLEIRLADTIAAHADVSDVVLFGFSMGGLIATELAVRLERDGTPPAALIVAGCPPPDAGTADRALSRLSDADLLQALRDQEVMPDVVADNAELVGMLLPVWRADAEVVESHPRRPVSLSCPVFAICGDADLVVGADAVRQWSRVSSRAEVRFVPGGHAAPIADDVIGPFVSAAAVAAGLSSGV